MIENIRPVQVKRLFGNWTYCFEDTIVTILNFLGFDYEYIFARSWNFSYAESNSSNKKTLAERIVFDNYVLESLEKYYGIKLDYHNTMNVNDVIDIVKKQLALNKPIIVRFDAYFCPWDPEYKRKHMDHMSLVVGFDELKEQIHFVDPFHMKENLTLSVKDFESGCGFCYTYEIDKICDFDKVDINEVIKDAVSPLFQKNGLNNDFEKMRLLAKDLEILSYDCNDIPVEEIEDLSNEIKNFCVGRQNFSLLLNLLYEKSKNENIAGLIKEFGSIFAEWQTLCNILNRGIVSGNTVNSLKKSSIWLKDFADREEVLASKLLDISKLNEALSNNYYERSMEIDNTKQINVIDIDKYFNNNMLINALSDENNIYETGRGFLYIDKTLSNINLNIDNMLFKFPKISEGLFDNISCNSEKIDVPIDEYEGIMLMSCADWGEYIDKLVLYFEDGDVEEIPFLFSEFATWGNKVIQQKIACESKFVKKMEEGFEEASWNCYIYAGCVGIKTKKKLKAIQLPEVPAAHVFALSLYK